MVADKKVNTFKETKKMEGGYKVVGDRFTSKREAKEALQKAFGKGFKGTGLLVQEDKFVVLFGTYATAGEARASAEAVKAAGLAAEVFG